MRDTHNNKETPVDLTFSASGILERGKGLTFDDVLLVPRYSEISSRKHPVLKSKIIIKFYNAFRKYV